MQAKKTLLMVIPNYGFGGAQRVFSSLVNELAGDYKIVEVVFNNDEVDVYAGTGIKTSLRVGAGSNLFYKAINFFKRCRALRKIKVEYNCAIAVSHLEGANFINILSFGPGKKVICVHGSKTAEDSNRKGFIKFAENKILTPVLYSIADKVVTVSNGIAQELETYFHIQRNKIQVILNGIDPVTINTLANEEIPTAHRAIFNKKVLVYAGRLAPQKNPLALIEIHKRSIRQVDYNLLIIGDGPLKDKMLEHCQQAGISYFDESRDKIAESATVFFLGFQTNPFNYLRRSTVFILTSDFEGFPLAPCEALACGLPVIATDCPTGVREILAPERNSVSEPLATAEYAAYGILMPLVPLPFDADKVRLWSDTVVKMLTEETLLQKYRKVALLRAAELSQENFILTWKTLLASLH